MDFSDSRGCAVCPEDCLMLDSGREQSQSSAFVRSKLHGAVIEFRLVALCALIVQQNIFEF